MRFSTPVPPHDLTYSDVFLVPSRSDVPSRLDVDLAPGDGTGATLPIVAANMNSVTGPRLAATLARRGGLGVLPQDLSMDEMVAAIDQVKSASPVWDDPFDPRDPRLAGADLDSLPTLDVLDARDAFDALVTGGHEFARVAAGGTTSRKSALRGTLYAPALDRSGRLLVAAALGINGDVAGKARALVDAGADVLVLDTAHGHQEGMLRALVGREEARARRSGRRGQHRHPRGGAGSRGGRRRHPEGGRGAGRDVHDAHDDGGRAPAVLRGARDRGGGARARRARLGGWRCALPARCRARARGRRRIGDDRLVVRRHDRGARRARDRRLRPRLQAELGHGVDEGRARPVRRPRPLRAGAQGALRRGHLELEDLPRPAASVASRTCST